MRGLRPQKKEVILGPERNQWTTHKSTAVLLLTQPTAITGPSTISPYNCTFTATFANSHVNPGFGVSPGDSIHSPEF